MLLERAQGVLVEMRNARLQTDPFLWNALIAAAGRAGQLQRAFQNLDDMQVCCASWKESTLHHSYPECRLWKQCVRLMRLLKGNSNF